MAGKFRAQDLRTAMVRRHHEELTVLPALSLLLPFAGVLWLRIKRVRLKPDTTNKVEVGHHEES